MCYIKVFFFLNHLSHAQCSVGPEQVSVYFLKTRACSSVSLLHTRDAAARIRKWLCLVPWNP